MSAPLTYLAPQTFDRACDRLSDAQASYTDAANALAEAKCTLELVSSKDRKNSGR